MKNSNRLIFFLIGLIVLCILYIWTTYNSLISLNEEVETGWAQVENQYQRRFDLIPNLEASIKGTLLQEQKVFGEIADARTKYSGSTSITDKVGAANSLESALGRLLVIMESYPELKSNKNITDLMVALEGTENRISVERKRYNDLVKIYNLKVKRIPASLIASYLGYEEKPYFEALPGSETAPKIDLSK